MIFGLVLAFKIGNILIFDFKRLTEYGLGFLSGLIGTFLIILVLTIFMSRKIFKKKHLT